MNLRWYLCLLCPLRKYGLINSWQVVLLKVWGFLRLQNTCLIVPILIQIVQKYIKWVFYHRQTLRLWGVGILRNNHLCVLPCIERYIKKCVESSSEMYQYAHLNFSWFTKFISKMATPDICWTDCSLAYMV